MKFITARAVVTSFFLGTTATFVDLLVRGVDSAFASAFLMLIN